ncbi:MAG: 4'-phosphopantetheinyl transferase superfamily protein [Minisyncoccia bacterium]
MIIGVGIDLIEFQDFLRIYNFLKNRNLFKFIFYKEELVYIQDYKKLAGICALKEAVYKTISPFLKREILFKDIKIIKLGKGQIVAEIPKDYFLRDYQKKFFFRKKSKINFHLSLSYSRNSVIAISLAEINL